MRNWRRRVTERNRRELLFDVFSDIRGAGGDINETAGDGLMIIFQDASPWGHAASAVETALSIRDKTAARNLKETGKHPSLVVNMEYRRASAMSARPSSAARRERWTFTASGPSTNLAARLGGFARNGQILVSPETKRVQSHFLLRCIGPVELKNIGQPVEVWEAKAAI